jgi:hypothetical protein
MKHLAAGLRLLMPKRKQRSNICGQSACSSLIAGAQFCHFLIAVPLLFCAATLSVAKAQADTQPERITIPSADGQTTLVGYLYQPARPGFKAPAIVMMFKPFVQRRSCVLA